MLEKIKNPILFQGHLNKKNYFEGWYFKQVSSDQKISLSFIPGISLNEGDNHSFIQYILVITDDYEHAITHTGYVRYDISDFSYQKEPFSIKIGDSFFSEKMISIVLRDDKFHFQGKLELGELYPIKSSALQPNIMGIFGYIPKMECYHGVISMMHALNGSIEINKKTVNFSGGRGYIEKDWGTSFPKQYIWLHSNHFKNQSASLFFSIAHIPFYFTEFEGFICNFIVNGKEFRFATYNHSTCSIDQVSENMVSIHLENKVARLDIQAEILGQGELLAPVKGTMKKTIKEGISGILHVHLVDKESGQTFEDIGQNAGVEIVDYHKTSL